MGRKPFLINLMRFPAKSLLIFLIGAAGAGAQTYTATPLGPSTSGAAINNAGAVAGSIQVSANPQAFSSAMAP